MEVPPGSVSYLLEPLVDVIHGDVVLEDPCCRVVGHALITAHEAELRKLATAQTLPSGLQKAIEVYCVRSYLIDAPELLQESAVVPQTLQNFAEVLKGLSPQRKEESALLQYQDQPNNQKRSPAAHLFDLATPDALLASSGAAISDNTRALQQQHDDERLAHLIDALGDAVLGYMMRGASQCAQHTEACLDGAAPFNLSSLATTSYQASLQRFVDSAVVHRAVRERARDEAREAEVQELLFGAPVHATPAPQSNEENGPNDSTVTAAPPPPEAETAALLFANEVQAAMEEVQIVPEMQLEHQRLLKHPIPPHIRKGRLLQSVSDPVHEQLLALTQATPLPTLRQCSRSPSSAERDAVANNPASTPTGSSPVEASLSPDTVADPSTLIVEMSTISPPSLHSIQCETLPHVPARKLHKVDPVLIGASETSVLRMLENGGKAVDSGLTTSTNSPAPLSAQLQDIIGGTPVPPPTATAPITIDDLWEGVQCCVRRQEAEARSYFLSPSTNRFEPCVARGFFE